MTTSRSGSEIALTLSEVKWESIEPEPNGFAFGPADEIVHFAESVGAKMRGHNFMWYVRGPRECMSSSLVLIAGPVAQGQPAASVGEHIVDGDRARQGIEEPYHDDNGSLSG